MDGPRTNYNEATDFSPKCMYIPYYELKNLGRKTWQFFFKIA